MPSEESPQQPNTVPADVSIEATAAGLDVVFTNLALSAENPDSPKAEVTFKKNPVSPVEGRSFGAWSVFIDKEPSEQMKAITAEAEQLKGLPEEERVRAVLDLLLSHLQYAYEDRVEKVRAEDPEKADWISKNVGVKESAMDVPLSKVFENGFGVCNHLSSAYIWLADKAGLKGALLASQPGSGMLKNVLNPATGEPLFKSAAVGKPLESHAWTEIQMPDGRWLPVDPTTKLVGDTEQNMQTFRDANYKAAVMGAHTAVDVRCLNVCHSALAFEPGAPEARGEYWLNLKNNLNSPATPSWIEDSYSGNAKLGISVAHTGQFGIQLSI